MKKFLSNLWNGIRWYLPDRVATIHVLEEHFNLTDDEVRMLKACTEHKLLKEYVCPGKEKDELGNPLKLYIVLKVRDCRRLINLRRKHTKHELH